LNVQSERKPLNVIESLSAGFDAVVRAPQVMLAPVLLDLFLWLGPRLSAYPYIHRVAASLGDLAQLPGMGTNAQLVQQLAQIQAALEEVGKQVNLFSWLNPFLLGLPSLMAGAMDAKQPWALTAPVWEIGTGLEYFGLFVLLSLVGTGLIALYWSQVARAALSQWPDGRSMPGAQMSWPAHAWQVWLGLVKLAMVLIVIGVILGIPTAVVSFIVALISAGLAALVIIMGLSILMWVAIYLVFVMHGIALRQSSFLDAVRVSVALLRFQFLPSSGVLILGVVIYAGLRFVWSMSPDDSWLRAAAILGNAFIASGVLCATAFFYLARVPAPATDQQLTSNEQQATSNE
jgi:hypothetical protein